MKIFKSKAIQFCGVICLVPMLLSSCSSKDPNYSQWGEGPVMVDAGPRAVTEMGSEEEPLEIGSTVPAEILWPEPVAQRGRRSPPASEVMARNKKKPAKDFQGWLQGH